MKRCSALFITREIQIKTTMMYHLQPVRMPSSKNLQVINAGKGVGKREPLALLVGTQIDTATVNSMEKIP